MAISDEAFALAFDGLAIEDGLKLREACKTRYFPAKDRSDRKSTRLNSSHQI